jgi:5'-deoxynucleotidase YfbR-like HD superfamily hydrolase
MAATKRDAVPRAWQRMLSGRRLDLLDPSPLDIEIEDIAHGLARVARWNGQTKGIAPFSGPALRAGGAFVHQLKPRASRTLRLAALLHDAAEYVIGDLISPFKTAVGLDTRPSRTGYARHPHPLRAAARMHPEETALIKRADRISAFFEATNWPALRCGSAPLLRSADRR